MIDIVMLKKEIIEDKLQLIFYKNNILIKDTQTEEVVKIGELPKEDKWKHLLINAIDAGMILNQNI